MKERCLARAVWSNQGDELTSAYVERDPVDDNGAADMKRKAGRADCRRRKVRRNLLSRTPTPGVRPRPSAAEGGRALLAGEPKAPGGPAVPGGFVQGLKGVSGGATSAGARAFTICGS